MIGTVQPHPATEEAPQVTLSDEYGSRPHFRMRVGGIISTAWRDDAHVQPMFQIKDQESSSFIAEMYASQPMNDEDLDAWVRTGDDAFLIPEVG